MYQPEEEDPEEEDWSEAHVAMEVIHEPLRVLRVSEEEERQSRDQSTNVHRMLGEHIQYDIRHKQSCQRSKNSTHFMFLSGSK
jgi:hypothetical protein